MKKKENNRSPYSFSGSVEMEENADKNMKTCKAENCNHF